MPNDQRDENEKEEAFSVDVSTNVYQNKIRWKKWKLKTLILLRDELHCLFTHSPSMCYLFCCQVQWWLHCTWNRFFNTNRSSAQVIFTSHSFFLSFLFLLLKHFINEVLDVRPLYTQFFFFIDFSANSSTHIGVYLTLSVCFLIAYLNKFSIPNNNEKSPRIRNHLPNAIENDCTDIG